MDAVRLIYTRTDGPNVTHVVDQDGSYRYLHGSPLNGGFVVRVDQKPLDWTGFEAMNAIECAVTDLFPNATLSYEDGLEIESRRVHNQLRKGHPLADAYITFE